MATPSYVVSAEKRKFYREHGWVILEDFVSPAEVARIKYTLDAMVEGRISTARRRGDLGGHADRVDPSVENIIQISWPTDLTSALDESEYMRAARDVSEQLYGDPGGTWAMDMNQFLVKMVRGGTERRVSGASPEITHRKSPSDCPLIAISLQPHTLTDTPWHQDQAYYVGLVLPTLAPATSGSPSST